MLDSAAARESAMLGWDFSKMQLPLSHSCSCLDRAPLCSASALYIWGKQILLTSSYSSRTPHYTPQNLKDGVLDGQSLQGPPDIGGLQ